MIPYDDRYISPRGNDWQQVVERYAHESCSSSYVIKSAKLQSYVRELHLQCENRDPQQSLSVLFRSRNYQAQSSSYCRSLKELDAKSVRFEKKPLEDMEQAISETPTRILDAPDILDDYYITQIDSSRQQEEHLIVALESTVYTHHINQSATTEVDSLSEQQIDNEEYFSAVRWLNNPHHFLVATSSGAIRVNDLEKKRSTFHSQVDTTGNRVGCAEPYQATGFFAGTQGGQFAQFDTRTSARFVQLFGDDESRHQKEVCSLKLHPSDYYLASGANDSMVKIWDVRKKVTPIFTVDEHKAAVKALCWSPTDPDKLFSGGGTLDRTIRVTSLSRQSVIDSETSANSQITAIHVHSDGKSVVTTHGFSLNQVIVWRYQSGFKKVRELNGHTNRILSLVPLANGTTVVTAAADETLRFWNIFSPRVKRIDKKLEEMDFSKGKEIR